MSFAGLKVHSCFPCIPDLLSLLVCLFCPLCVSVVTFDSKDKDKREVCGGSSCSSKDDGLIRLVCAFSVIVCYLIALSGCLLCLQLLTSLICVPFFLVTIALTYRHEHGMNYNFIRPDLIVGSCLQVLVTSFFIQKYRSIVPTSV